MSNSQRCIRSKLSEYREWFFQDKFNITYLNQDLINKYGIKPNDVPLVKTVIKYLYILQYYYPDVDLSQLFAQQKRVNNNATGIPNYVSIQNYPVTFEERIYDLDLQHLDIRQAMKSLAHSYLNILNLNEHYYKQNDQKLPCKPKVRRERGQQSVRNRCSSTCIIASNQQRSQSCMGWQQYSVTSNSFSQYDVPYDDHQQVSNSIVFDESFISKDNSILFNYNINNSFSEQISDVKYYQIDQLPLIPKLPPPIPQVNQQRIDTNYTLQHTAENNMLDDNSIQFFDEEFVNQSFGYESMLDWRYINQ